MVAVITRISWLSPHFITAKIGSVISAASRITAACTDTAVTERPQMNPPTSSLAVTAANTVFTKMPFGFVLIDERKDRDYDDERNA